MKTPILASKPGLFHRQTRLRRAFTLLEVTLATAIGGMVILVSLSLLVSMEKLERPLAVRQQELADLHRTRTVIQRAISSLVMSDTTAPVNPNQRRTNNSTTTDQATTDEKSAFEATAEATANKQQQQQRPPARLLLEADQTDDLKSALQAVGVPMDSAVGIQRLELVVDSAPIAPNFRAELGDAIAATYSRNSSGLTSSSNKSSNSTSGGSGLGLNSSGASAPSTMTNRDAMGARSGNNRRSRNLGRGQGNSNQTSAQAGSLRGAFEIRPMVTPENEFDRRNGKPVLYELWWTPLPSAKDTSKLGAATNAPVNQKEDDPRTVYAWGEPVLLANNLVKCRWKLFSSGEQRTAHNAVWERELPAYVEFEIQTKTGLYENWMFEVSWSKGPELVTSATDGTGAAGDGAGGGRGGPGGQGGPNGPGGGPGGPGGPQGPHHGGPHNGGPLVPNPTGPSSGGPRYDTLPAKPK